MRNSSFIFGTAFVRNDYFVIAYRAMRKQILLAALTVFLFTQMTAFAQLAAPNDTGVTIGHIHLLSKDPDAQKKIWVEALGAQVTKTGTLEMLKLPGVFIIINRAEPSAGSVGSTADHLGLDRKSTRLNSSHRL